MKKFYSAAGAFGLAALTTSAAPFLAIGDSAEVFLIGTAGLEFNDNVTLTEDKVEDTIFEVAPGFVLEFGHNTLMPGSFTYVETISRYSDNDELDSELSNLAFQSQYSEGKTTFAVHASFAQLNQNTVDARVTDRNQLSRRDVISVGADGELAMTAKTSAAAGVDYNSIDYKRPGFVDQDRLQFPVSVYYELTPKVDLSLGATLRRTEQDTPGADSDDQFYSVGARGDFTPKLSGAFRVGVTNRDIEGGDERTTLGLSSSFSYFYSEKTTATVAISNDFGNSGTGESQENFDVSVGLRMRVAPEFGISGRLYYRSIDYFVRPDDDYFEGQVEADYTINEYVSLVGTVVIRSNNSDLANGDFDNSVFRIGARVRY